MLLRFLNLNNIYKRRKCNAIMTGEKWLRNFDVVVGGKI